VIQCEVGESDRADCEERRGVQGDLRGGERTANYKAEEEGRDPDAEMGEGAGIAGGEVD